MGKKIRCIIAGCRNFTGYAYLKAVCDYAFKNVDLADVTIISGGAKGTDSLGEKYAKEHNISLEIYPADWEKFGKRAGPVRNSQMAETGTHLLAFWDGVSRGTKNMIEQAEGKGLKVTVIKLPPNYVA